MKTLQNITNQLKRIFKNFRRDQSPENQPIKTNLLKGTLNMETETPTKEQTGGLKIMTVFIFVLALHVFVIGGITVYHFFKGDNKNNEATAQTNATTTTAPAKDNEIPKDATTANDKTSLDPVAPPLPNATTGTPDLAKSGDPEAAEGSPIIKNSAAMPGTVAEAVAASTVTDNRSIAANKNAAPKSGPKTAVKAGVTVTNAPAPALVVSGTAGTYTVKTGDTLGRIARHNGMTVTELKSMNNLKSDVIRIGQNLQVKSGGTPVVAKATSPLAPITTAPSTIGISPNAGTPIMVGATSMKADGQTYKVVSGDSLVKIAKKFNTTPAALMAANKIVDANKLRIGANLIIPQKSDKHSVTEGTTPAAPTQTASTGGDLVLNK